MGGAKSRLSNYSFIGEGQRSRQKRTAEPICARTAWMPCAELERCNVKEASLNRLVFFVVDVLCKRKSRSRGDGNGNMWRQAMSLPSSELRRANTRIRFKRSPKLGSDAK